MSIFLDMRRLGSRPVLLVVTVLALGGGGVVAAAGTAAPGAGATHGQAAAATRAGDPVRTGALPLGPPGLPETRRTRTLQHGVTLTTIVRGRPDPADGWTVEVAVPRRAGSPDPDAPSTALSSQPGADALAARLQAQGFAARVEEVVTAPVADFAGGRLGFRVRVGAFADQAASDGELARVRGAGFAATSVFGGWDGRADDQGPWRVWVLTIDPRAFTGRLVASHGPDIVHRETTSALVARARARAGVNAGYFVLDPEAGAPGDPAGVGVYAGRVLSEAVNGRPGLVVRRDGGSQILRLRWRGRVQRGQQRLPLDGVNRVPGLIRSCGGTPDDQPTSAPRHDVTCTDATETVLFTPAYGARTPSGAGAEAVLDRRGVVRTVRPRRGGPVPPGGATVQATGQLAQRLRAVAAPGRRLVVRSRLSTVGGRAFSPASGTSVVNGGPVLVRGGALRVTAWRDGFVRNPSFYYGFSAKRNPRTVAGTDDRGRTVLIVVDGRSTRSLGLTLREAGQVAQSLGLRDAMNLDGGGSSTLVTGRTVRNRPSDPSGQRPVGDALLVLPRR
jgi:hypothetical protein